MESISCRTDVYTLATNGKPLQRRLKQPKRLPAHDERSDPADNIKHHQRQHNRQERTAATGELGPVGWKNGRKQMHQRKSRLGQRPQQKAEDQVRHKQRADCNDSGQNISLHAAQRVL